MYIYINTYIYICARVRGPWYPPYVSPLMGCPGEWNMHAMHAYACICTHMHEYIHMHMHSHA